MLIKNIINYYSQKNHASNRTYRFYLNLNKWDKHTMSLFGNKIWKRNIATLFSSCLTNKSKTSEIILKMEP